MKKNISLISLLALVLIMFTSCPTPETITPEVFTLTITTNGNGVVDKNVNQTTFEKGEMVTLTATPGSGCTFSGWSGAVTSTTNSITIEMDSDKSITAEFCPITYPINVITVGTGSYTKSPDKTSYNSGETVTLTATAGTGFYFNGWSQDIESNNPTISVVVSDTIDLKLNFIDSAVSNLLTITNVDSGIVTVSPNKLYYSTNEDVTISSTPNFGYKFSSWSGAGDSTSNPLVITMTSDLVITPVYSEIYQIQIVNNGSGTALANKVEYTQNENATVTATPSSGWIFDHWEGDASGSTNPLSITMDSSKSITAVFLETFDISETSNNGSITFSPNQTTFTDGDSVTITATPDSGFVFSHWSGDLTGSVNPITTSVTSDMNITAVFLETFDISETSINGSITFSPNQTTFTDGDSVTITATPDSGYVFSHWTGDLTGSVNPLTTNVTSDMNVTAVFIESFTITKTSVNGTISTNPNASEFGDGTTVEVTATPNSGYIFDHWEGDLSGTDETTTITMDSDKSVTAVFIEREWLIMVYLDADNDLEPAAIEDFNEMESVDLRGSGIEVVTLLDRSPSYDSSNGNWSNTRLYKVKYDSNGIDNTIISERLASTELGLTKTGNEELNMGESSNISNFIDYGKNNFEANKYMIIFWNHGSGWRTLKVSPELDKLSKSAVLTPDENDIPVKAICSDDTDGDILFTQEVGDGVYNKGLDIIGFDLCYGGMLEIAYEIKDDASYMIGSEETEPGDGWEYQLWLESFKNTTKTELNLLESVVNAYETRYAFEGGTTLSAIDLSKINSVVTSLNAFSTKLTNIMTTSAIQSELANLLYNNTEQYYSIPGDQSLDIGDMASKVISTTDYADTEALALSNAITDAVVYEWHNSTGHPNSTGLALYFVSLTDTGTIAGISSAYDKGYTGLYPVSFVNNTTWSMDSANNTGFLFKLWYTAQP